MLNRWTAYAGYLVSIAEKAHLCVGRKRQHNLGRDVHRFSI